MTKGCDDCRSRKRFNLIMSGATGGGFLLAGFGLAWGIVGMIVGAVLAYLTERRYPYE